MPAQYNFEWRTPSRNAIRYGENPHVSIEDRVFVECVGGDLTIKIEDNTATGGGIYDEEVEDKLQSVDDAKIQYAIQGSLILLKVTPCRENVTRYFIYNENCTKFIALGYGINVFLYFTSKAHSIYKSR